MAGTILVAEDDPEARELLLLLLSGNDYRVLEASDGVTALDLVRTEHPDLLITDIVMPHMDGYELVRRVREDQRIAETPVIFCTASYHEREVRAIASSLGVLTTLAKPYDVHAVHSVVERALLDGTRARSAPAPLAQALPGLPEQSARSRLDSLVAFTRQLFSLTDAAAIPAAACHATREILMAQYVELVLHPDSERELRCQESGLPQSAASQLARTTMFRELLHTLREGGCAQYPMGPAEPAQFGRPFAAGELVSMLGVPVASGREVYGYLCLANRIGLTGFTDGDLAVARAIAAQVAVAYENAERHRSLQEQIEQRALAEAEVRRLNGDLERRVAERTAELEIANRELEAFSYSVAHDLRAPLRLIDAHVQMLREEHDELRSPLAIARIDHIRRGAAHMSALIDGLLALSRVSHVEMKQERVSLNTLVTQALERLEPELHLRSIEWRVGPLPCVTCDPELMRQVMVNLIANAVKYTRTRRGARIDIGVGSTDAETYIYVRDNGVGFDMRYADRLFGVFQRLHHPSEFEGTGIGLATVSRIIERHGGRIWAEAAVDQGASFRFTLAGMPGL